MPLSYTQKIYAYWGVLDPTTFQHYKRQGVPCLGEAPVLLSAFIHRADPLFAIADLVSPFLLPRLPNFFLKCWLYTNSYNPNASKPASPSELFSLWSIWGKWSCFTSITEWFPLGTCFLTISETSTLSVGLTPPIHTQKVLKSREHVLFCTGGFEQTT